MREYDRRDYFMERQRQDASWRDLERTPRIVAFGQKVAGVMILVSAAALVMVIAYNIGRLVVR